MPGTVSGSGYALDNQTEKITAIMQFTFYWNRQVTKQDK